MAQGVVVVGGRPRSEKPMQEPVHVTGFHIAAVAAPEQPETTAILVLHPEIVAHRAHFPVTLPPFAGDPFRSIRSSDPMAHPAPGEGDRGVSLDGIDATAIDCDPAPDWLR